MSSPIHLLMMTIMMRVATARRELHKSVFSGHGLNGFTLAGLRWIALVTTTLAELMSLVEAVRCAPLVACCLSVTLQFPSRRKQPLVRRRP
jgi:hypothetical protein